MSLHENRQHGYWTLTAGHSIAEMLLFQALRHDSKIGSDTS